MMILMNVMAMMLTTTTMMMMIGSLSFSWSHW